MDNQLICQWHQSQHATHCQCRNVITGHNKVAKVIFLHLFVILFRGGCLPQCMLGYHPLGADTPWSRHPPRVDTSLEQAPPWNQTPPRTRYTPSPRTKYTPPGKQTPAYGQRAAGKHPTGMHSCIYLYSPEIEEEIVT